MANWLDYDFSHGQFLWGVICVKGVMPALLFAIDRAKQNIGVICVKGVLPGGGRITAPTHPRTCMFEIEIKVFLIAVWLSLV